MTEDQVRRFAHVYGKTGSIREVARSEGISYWKAHQRYTQALELELIKGHPKGGRRRESYIEDAEDTDEDTTSRVHAVPLKSFALPPKGRVYRYLLTSAQNNTDVHQGLWPNFQALAHHPGRRAQLMVSRFVYDKRSQRGMDKRSFLGSRRPSSSDKDVWWAPELERHLSDERIALAPGLIWCGEMNTLPTAVRPLSGLESYTGRQSGIFPHTKLAMVSVPSGKHEGTKFSYTTGAVTRRNYIQRKAGLKAEFHHCYGALLVEVDSEGDWFVRQLNANSEGDIQDLDVLVKDGKVTTGHTVEAINWGDIHQARLNKVVAELSWGAAGMLGCLCPKYQIINDLLDFRSRNHHNIKDPHKMFERWAEGEESVENEVLSAARWLHKIDMSWCEMIVVDSNHDNAMTQWLREADYRQDPINATFFLEAQLRLYQAFRDGESNFHLLEWAIERAGVSVARFLREDESFIICPDANGGIECGMHGHLGPNGTRGGANAFSRMGRKSTVAHTHQAGILDGVYTTGTSSELDMEYNRGPGSWSHSHVVTYPTGKRTIITLWNGKWRAS